MFNPVVGRFMQTDLRGFAAGDPNLYRYVGNSPTNATDPSGLEEAAPWQRTMPQPSGSGKVVSRMVEEEVDALVYQGPNQPYKLQKVKRQVREYRVVPLSPDEVKIQRMVAADNAKRQAVKEALAAAKEFNDLAKQIKVSAAKRFDELSKSKHGIPHRFVEEMEKDGKLATAFGPYTVVTERLSDTSYFIALLEKGTHRESYIFDKEIPLKDVRYEIALGKGKQGPTVHWRGSEYRVHAHSPNLPKFDVVGGLYYYYLYGTSYRLVFSATIDVGSKGALDRMMSDPDFRKGFADRYGECKSLEEANKVNNFLAGKFIPDLLIDVIPGINLADKIQKGNGWDIAIAVLEDGSTVLGLGLVTKSAKATAKARVVASAMIGTAAAVNYGKAAYEFRYGDQQKAMLYLSEAKLRLLGFTAIEINQIKKAGDALRRLEKAAYKAANCFPEATLVGTETGLRPIKTVNPGERVWAFDFGAGSWQLCPVECRHDATFTGPVVTLDTGTGELTATAGHPFWVIEGDGLENRPPAGELPPEEDRGGALPGRWVDSQHLRVGDVILRRDEGPARIERVVVRDDTVAVCNLTIAGLHTFAVGSDQVLVHNTSDSEKLIAKAGEAAAGNPQAAKEAEEIATKAAAPVVPVPVKPTVQPGAIGLGLDHNLRDLSRMGATTYEKWFESGLTRVRPEQANLSPYKFKQAFTDAAEKAPQIVFDVTDLNVPKALADGSKGFVSKNYTNAELHHIVTNEGLLGKTTFVDKGQVVKPVIQDGKVVGFAP